MEIEKRIKEMRQKRGITQEAMAQHFGLTPQAISKWERGVATPDIALLPDISAYFGVTIDELFALSDDTRMERIRNMLWDDRYYDPAEVQSTREFLLDKGKREPENGEVYAFLAEMENHLAEEHREKAEMYAKEALRRDPDLRTAHLELNAAMGGKCPDWNGCNHYLQIKYYQEFIEKDPDNWRAYMWLMDQLIDDYRLDEAERYCDSFAQINNTYRVPLYRGMIAWQRGQREDAFRIWKQMEFVLVNSMQVCGTIERHWMCSRRHHWSIRFRRWRSFARFGVTSPARLRRDGKKRISSRMFGKSPVKSLTAFYGTLNGLREC